MEEDLMKKKIFLYIFMFITSFLYAGEKNLSIGIGVSSINLGIFFRSDAVIMPLPIVEARYKNFYIKGRIIGYDVLSNDQLVLSLFANPFDGYDIKP